MAELWLEASAGIAGDMFLGALLDLGYPVAELNAVLGRLGVRGLQVGRRRVRRGAFTGVQATVRQPDRAQPHRGLPELLRLIERTRLPESARRRARDVFERLARAEAKLHGVPVAKVHFHEVGALDALGEVVGVCAGLDHLGVTRVYVGAVNVGSGHVRMHHGQLPAPAPATLELLRGFELYSAGPAAEHATPTGAALLAALAQPAPVGRHWRVTRVGYGAGQRDWPEFPNLLRAALAGTPDANGWESDTVTVLTTHLDDATPQQMGYALERLFAAGALDVTLAPVQMKKDRPGLRLEVLAPPERAQALAHVVFQETPTLGVRWDQQQRWTLPRRVAQVAVPGGRVHVKISASAPGRQTITPEYEDVRRCALRAGRPLAEILDLARRKAKEIR